MLSADVLIKQLNLLKHPEGGYYSETYRSNLAVSADGLPNAFGGDRNICTSIYFLLPSGDSSRLHKIKSDELWFYHAGASLSLYVLFEGRLTIHKLGADFSSNENFQLVVPAGAWFGATCNEENAFTLCGCVVSPGFDFQDFELANRSQLLKEYPSYKDEIVRLTNED